MPSNATKYCHNKVVNALLWEVLRSDEILIGLEEVRGQKLIIDSRCWYDLNVDKDNLVVTSCRKSQRNCKLNATSANETNPELQAIFWQLYNLCVNQLRILVLFEKLKNTKQKQNITATKHIIFHCKCKELLSKMSIPYEDVDDVDLESAKRIKNNDFDACLTSNSTILLYGGIKIFHYKQSEATLSRFNQSVQLMKLARYSTDDHLNRSNLLPLYALLTMYQSQQQPKKSMEKGKQDYVNQRIRLFSTGGDHDDSMEDQEIDFKKSKPSHKNLNSTKKKITKTTTQTLDNKNSTNEKMNTNGKTTTMSIDFEVRTKNNDGSFDNDRDGVDDEVVKLIVNFVQHWKDKAMNRLEHLCSEVNSTTSTSTVSSSTSVTTSTNYAGFERDIAYLFNGKLKKILDSLKEEYNINTDNLGSPRNDNNSKWSRPNFEELLEYSKNHLHMLLPCKQLLGYVVAYDLYHLSNGVVSGDSFPDGFCRPEKITRLIRKKEVELYEVRWSYIPGTDSVKTKDLITTEYKNVFSAAFPKIASKFEGWKLRSDDDDDDEDGGVGSGGGSAEEFVCKSPSPVKNKRKRNQCDTPASNSSGKTTMKDYYVARKRLHF